MGSRAQKINLPAEKNPPACPGRLFLSHAGASRYKDIDLISQIATKSRRNLHIG
jgi:hypothetical protein